MKYFKMTVFPVLPAFIFLAWGCGKDFSEANITIPSGIAILYADNEEHIFKIDTFFYFIGKNSPRDIQKIVGEFTLFAPDSSFYKSYGISLKSLWNFPDENPDGRIRYGHIIDGDQPGEAYEIVPYTKVVKLIDFDEAEQRLYIKFGGTFIRKERDTWNLDIPYRVDWYAVVHSHYRIQ